MSWSASVSGKPVDDAIRALRSQLAGYDNGFLDRERQGHRPSAIERNVMNAAMDLVETTLRSKGFKHCSVSMAGHISYVGPDSVDAERGYEITGGQLSISVTNYFPIRE